MEKSRILSLDHPNERKAKNLWAKVARFEEGFRRQYPLLVDYVNGTRPVEDCKTSYYRDKIRGHLRLMKQLKGEAEKLLEVSAKN